LGLAGSLQTCAVIPIGLIVERPTTRRIAAKSDLDFSLLVVRAAFKPRILAFFSFSNKHIATNLDKRVAEFSSRSETAFGRRLKSGLLALISSIRRSAWLWEVD
jgi:hypothetical protein